MSRYVTKFSLATGEDRELSRVAFGRRGFVFIRTSEGDFAVLSVLLDGERIEEVKYTQTVHRRRIEELRRACVSAIDAHLAADQASASADASDGGPH
jgi:hypothetical protein